MRYVFRSAVRRWEARRDDWYFVDLPAGASEEIREWADALPRAGFGAVKVAARIGATRWSTSIFPDGGVYTLALNGRVRRAEGIGYGDEVEVEIELV